MSTSRHVLVRPVLGVEIPVAGLAVEALRIMVFIHVRFDIFRVPEDLLADLALAHPGLQKGGGVGGGLFPNYGIRLVLVIGQAAVELIVTRSAVGSWRWRGCLQGSIGVRTAAYCAYCKRTAFTAGHTGH